MLETGFTGTSLQLTFFNFITYFLLFLYFYSIKVQNEKIKEELDACKYAELEP